MLVNTSYLRPTSRPQAALGSPLSGAPRCPEPLCTSPGLRDSTLNPAGSRCEHGLREPAVPIRASAGLWLTPDSSTCFLRLTIPVTSLRSGSSGPVWCSAVEVVRREPVRRTTQLAKGRVG